MTQIIHLQMRFEAIKSLCKRMKCESSIIDENIHFAVVALLNNENLLHQFCEACENFIRM